MKVKLLKRLRRKYSDKVKIKIENPYDSGYDYGRPYCVYNGTAFCGRNSLDACKKIRQREIDRCVMSWLYNYHRINNEVKIETELKKANGYLF